MNYLNTLKEVDKSKNNLIIKIVSGKNKDSKLILSEGQAIYTNNTELNWDPIIEAIPENKKSQTLNIDDGKVYIEFMRQEYNVVV